MRLDYAKLAPEAAKALFQLSTAIGRSALDPVLRELVAVLVSELNGCAHCIAVHWKKALAAGATDIQLRLLPAFEEAAHAGSYDRRTLVALRLAERLTSSPAAGVDDALWDEATDALGEEALTWLVHQIMLMNAWNRLSIALRIAPPDD